jgi:hypothetical protein
VLVISVTQVVEAEGQPGQNGSETLSQKKIAMIIIINDS